MKLKTIEPSTNKNKKMKAIFTLDNDKTKTVHFGYKGSQTYLDHKDDKKKQAYLARHKVNENWNDPTTPGSLAKNILWNKTTLSASISDFKKRYNL